MHYIFGCQENAKHIIVRCYYTCTLAYLKLKGLTILSISEDMEQLKCSNTIGRNLIW
jgi:hypothetical protein